MVKNPSAVQELQGMQVQSLGQEDPLEREMATHSSILAWRNPWTKEPGGLQSMGSQESDTTEQLTLSLSLEKLAQFFFGSYEELSLSLFVVQSL